MAGAGQKVFSAVGAGYTGSLLYNHSDEVSGMAKDIAQARLLKFHRAYCLVILFSACPARSSAFSCNAHEIT